MSKPAICVLDISKPINVEFGLNSFAGNKEVFYTMLSDFEPMSLDKSLEQMATAVDKRDYCQLMNIAHSIKGSCGYIGVSRMHYATYFIQEHYMNKKFEK